MLASGLVEGTLDRLVWPNTIRGKVPVTLVYTGFLLKLKNSNISLISIIVQIWHQSRAACLFLFSFIHHIFPHNMYGVIVVNIIPSPRASHICWWSPLTSLTKGKLTLCHLPPAKEILVITCSFLNIIKHQAFHHCECVTFKLTASLSVTDGSCEGQCWTIFISSLTIQPKNRALCWPLLQSAQLGYESTSTPPPHTHPLLTSPWPKWRSET